MYSDTSLHARPETQQGKATRGRHAVEGISKITYVGVSLTGSANGGCGSTRGEELHALRGQKRNELDEACLVGHGEQRALDFALVGDVASQGRDDVGHPVTALE